MKNILNKLKSLSNGLPRSKELAMTSRVLAFSLIEIMISLIVISLIAAAFSPIITKKLKSGNISIGTVSASGSIGSNGSSNTPNPKCIERTGVLNCSECGPTLCTSCADGYFLKLTEQECIACTTYHDDSNCTKCNQQACSECLDGYYLDSESKKCISCSTIDSNCTKCSNATSCTKCTSGYSPSNNGSSCIQCSDINCSECDTNTGKCITCKDNYYVDDDGSCKCV